MRIRAADDFWAGVMFVAFGLFFAGFATQYDMGTAARMGPGYFPFWLGVLLCILGVAVALSALSANRPESRVERFDFKILLLILGSVVLFGIALRPLGLFAALFILVAVSSLASHEFGWKAMLINAAVLILLCWLVFIKGLSLVFPLWPAFLN